jgi:phage tail-like protein
MPVPCDRPYSRFNFLVTIQLHNEDHTAVVKTWKLIGAYITKTTGSPLEAKGTDVAMEEFTLSYEQLEIS